jgi:uncharacterized protein YjbI with pentapeptide repeats
VTEGRGSRVAAWTLLVTTVLGGLGYWQKNEELSNKAAELKIAEDQLAVQRDTAKAAADSAESARGQLDAALGQLEIKQAEIERIQRGSIDEVTVRIDSTRQLLANAADVDARTEILRSFARRLRDDSRRATPLTSFHQPLPSGLSESAAFLSTELHQDSTKVDLSGIDLHGHYWHGAHLNNSLLRYSDLRAVDLSNSSLVNTYFEGAALKCADLHEADLTDTHLDGADLSFTNLRSLDLSTTDGLTNAQLTGASYDDQTLFPDSVKREELAPSAAYADTRTCAVDHLRDE